MAPRETTKANQVGNNSHPQKVVDKSGKMTLQVKVYSPFRTYFDDRAYSVSAVNLTGPLDILPHHHQFISLLEPCELILATARGDQKIKISGGIMHVKGDRATVLLDA